VIVINEPETVFSPYL